MLNDVLCQRCAWCGNDTECDCQERMDCDKAGEPMHTCCGVCEHGQPVFICFPCFSKAARGEKINYSDAVETQQDSEEQ